MLQSRRRVRRARVSLLETPSTQVVLRPRPPPQQASRLVIAPVKSTPRPRRRNRNSRVSASAPSAFGSVLKSQAPVIRSSGKSTIITHSEILGTVTGTTDFSAQSWALIPSILPWMGGGGSGGPAASFSRYRWLRLSARFITASPTAWAGAVAMGGTYDIRGSGPESISEIQQMDESALVPVWSPGLDCSVTFSCDWNQKWYSFMRADEPQNDAFNPYIPALLYMGKQTSVNGQIIGYVMLDYTIELVNPIPARLNTVAPAVSRKLIDPGPSIDFVTPSTEQVLVKLLEQTNLNTKTLFSIMDNTALAVADEDVPLSRRTPLLAARVERRDREAEASVPSTPAVVGSTE